MPNIDTNTDWIDAVQELEAKGEAFVLVTVLGTKGSTPRDVGTKMVFNTESSCGTIGGDTSNIVQVRLQRSYSPRENSRKELRPFR